MFVIIIIVIIIVIVIVIVIVSSNSNKRPRLGCGGWAVGAGIPQHHFLISKKLENHSDKTMRAVDVQSHHPTVSCKPPLLRHPLCHWLLCVTPTVTHRKAEKRPGVQRCRLLLHHVARAAAAAAAACQLASWSKTANYNSVSR